MSALLEVSNMTKAFFGIAAVKGVTLSVQQGQILGLIGQNGAGKSTLMNLIGGVVLPDSGTMTLNGQPFAPRTPSDAQRAGIAFIHQELNLFTNLSIAENIFISNFPRNGFGGSIDRSKIRALTRELLASVGLDISPDTSVERISPGERQLVEIAKALYQDASLIIFDEPTTSLTARETERLFRIMRQLREQGKGIIYISHILGDVLELSDQIAIMRDGELVGYEPAAQYTIQRMISQMVGRSIEQLFPPRTASPGTSPLLEVEHVSANGIVEDISFTLHSGEVLGLFGLMGSGRTELARMIFGVDPFEGGAIRVEGEPVRKPSPRSSIRNNIAFVTENRREEGLLMSIDIANNISLVSLPEFARTFVSIIDQRQMYESARETAAILQLKSGDIRRQTAKALSGGNQQKVVIAKWLISRPSIFIMDEPTRGIDVGAKFEIYTIIDRLAAEGSGVLIISSELDELMGMCDRILVMSRGELLGEFARGQFDEERILRAAFRENDLVADGAKE
ncbi:MAG: sugar ABC transporter ATP-binding protein [Chloroflexi bacterium]|nr:sugar ABC transporter ATP-binding protein [Chloroflexota bacterium]